jgi:hypothetical protein
MTASIAPSLERPLEEEVSMRQARSQLRAQISRLEQALSRAELDCARASVSHPRPRSGGPKIGDLGELERQRDALIDAISRATVASERIEAQRATARSQLEAMIANPAGFKFVRIRNSQLGLPSCKTYEVMPRLGLIGMLAGWWQVKISSGCP